MSVGRILTVSRILTQCRNSLLRQKQPSRAASTVSNQHHSQMVEISTFGRRMRTYSLSSREDFFFSARWRGLIHITDPCSWDKGSVVFMGVSISGRMTRAYCSSPRKCFSWRDRLLMEAERHVDRDDVLGKVSNQIGHTCQSFAFVRAAELAFRIHYGLKLKLSMQDLLDAGQVFGTEKSVSGNAFRNEIIVFKWIQKNGIYLEGDYPELIIRWLDELDGYCDQLTRWLFEDDNYPNQFQDCKIKVGGRMIKPGSDGINLLHAIHRQPVLLGIYFEDDQFFYLKGELYKERKKSSQVMSGLIDYIDQSTGTTVCD